MSAKTDIKKMGQDYWSCANRLAIIAEIANQSINDVSYGYFDKILYYNYPVNRMIF